MYIFITINVLIAIKLNFLLILWRKIVRIFVNVFICSLITRVMISPELLKLIDLPQTL